MTSIQERLQLKREPLDKWSVREQLCLASAVARSGDQNWVSVARALKPFGDPNRPQDWFSQKNCAAQYGALLGNVETPKRKKRQSGADAGVETPTEVILRKLLSERQAELQKLLAEEKAEYQSLHEDMLLLQSGKVTEEQLDKWCKAIDEEEHRKEQEALAHSQWLKEREIRKQEIERAWRPIKSPYPIPGQKRKSSDILEGLIDNEQDDMQRQSPQLTPSVPESPKPALSPLLTSLLKSPSQVQNVSVAASSILHTAITNQRIVTSMITNPTISSLLNSTTAVTVSPSLQQLVSSAIGQEPGMVADQMQPLSADILDDPNLPNLKIDDLANSILVQDGPLPEIKKEEVDDIISEIIDNVQDIVDDPEQHLQLDGNGDININLELEDLEEEDDLAEVEIHSTEPKEPPVEVAKTTEKPKESKPESVMPEVDPFEFQEDPVIFESIKPSTPIKDSKQYIPQYQQMQLHQQQLLQQQQQQQQQQMLQQHQQFTGQQNQHQQSYQHQHGQHQLSISQQQQHRDQLEEQKTVMQPDSPSPPVQQQQQAPVKVDPIPMEIEIVNPKVVDETNIQESESIASEEDDVIQEVVENPSPSNQELRSPQPEIPLKADTPEIPKESEEGVPATDPPQGQKGSGSVEIVEVVMEDLECSKELNKTQIQDIVHSNKIEEPEETKPEKPNEEEQEDDEEREEEEGEEEQQEEEIKSEEESKLEEKEVVKDEAESASDATDTKSTVDVNAEEQGQPETANFHEELYDNVSMEVKIDKTGKTKRDYSRTKKKEEKGLDVLLAIEKAHLEDVDFNEESIDHISDIEKKDIKLKKISENERSNSPWTEEEDVSSATGIRRYSTPATPIDSVPNSPASSITYDDDRDYRNWKKSVILVYNRLATNKYASLFLKPITEDQAPGYSSVVYRPMDLQTIKRNIESGVIRTTLEFKRDVMLMFTNAIMYNKTNDTVYNMAKQMQEESLNPIDILMQAQGQVSMPSRRETRTSESSSKRKRPIEENIKNKKRKED